MSHNRGQNGPLSRRHQRGCRGPCLRSAANIADFIVEYILDVLLRTCPYSGVRKHCVALYQLAEQWIHWPRARGDRARGARPGKPSTASPGWRMAASLWRQGRVDDRPHRSRAREPEVTTDQRSPPKTEVRRNSITKSKISTGSSAG